MCTDGELKVEISNVLRVHSAVRAPGLENPLEQKYRFQSQMSSCCCFPILLRTPYILCGGGGGAAVSRNVHWASARARTEPSPHLTNARCCHCLSSLQTFQKCNTKHHYYCTTCYMWSRELPSSSPMCYPFCRLFHLIIPLIY